MTKQHSYFHAVSLTFLTVAVADAAACCDATLMTKLLGITFKSLFVNKRCTPGELPSGQISNEHYTKQTLSVHLPMTKLLGSASIEFAGAEVAAAGLTQILLMLSTGLHRKKGIYCAEIPKFLYS
jgi:hypothetical protein